MCKALSHLLLGLLLALPALAQPPDGYLNVRNFGAVGDGKTDDTAAIKKAFEAAAAGRISEQPVPGEAYLNSLRVVYFPNGKYLLSEPLTPGGHMLGEGNAILWQPDPAKDIIYNDWCWRWRISGFTFLGGRSHLNIGNNNIDTGRIVIEDCVFQNSAGPAISIHDKTFSTQLTISNCVLFNCNQALVNWCDMAKMVDTWISTSPKMKDCAVFENHGWLLLEHICGVPGVTAENDQRWIDNYNGVTCRNFRFGGESAGFTVAVNKVRYDSTYPVIPSYLTFEACHVYALGNPARKCMIYLEEVPNQIIVRDCTGFPDLPVVAVSPKLDLDTYLADARQRGEACLRFYLSPNQVELRLRDLPEQLRPFQITE